MLDPDVDSLLDVPIADSFVDDDPDRGLGNVIDDSSFAVVDFVRHAVEMSAPKHEALVHHWHTLSAQRHLL